MNNKDSFEERLKKVIGDIYEISNQDYTQEAAAEGNSTPEDDATSYLRNFIAQERRAWCEEMWRDLKANVNNAQNCAMHYSGHRIEAIDDIWNDWREKYLSKLSALKGEGK